MTLQQKANKTIMKKIRDRLARQRVINALEKKMTHAIEMGDFDKVLEIKFLLDRLS